MASLLSYIGKRTLLFIPMMWFLLTLVFILLRVIPGGNPVRVINPQLPEQQVQKITEDYGLDKPLHEQYVDFLEDAVKFDFGKSFRTQGDINKELKVRWGPTLMLAITSIFIGVPLGVYLGGIAGANRENKKDQFARVLSTAFYSTPIFLVGILLQILFAYKVPEPLRLPALGLITPGLDQEFENVTQIWLIDALLAGRPDIALDIAIHLILPSITLGLLIASSISRQVRTHMIHELEQDYVHFSQARGIKDTKIKYQYALKNSFLPVISLIGLQFALLLSGAILTETVFNIAGLGTYLFDAISSKDYPAIQGVMVIFVLVINVVSLLSDIIYATLDPRIRF